MANKKNKYGLTIKEQRFADEYIANGRNATQAYKVIQPNSGDANARARGSEWCAKRNISEYIADKTRERLKASNLTADDVIDELISMGFSLPQKGYSKQKNNITGELEKDIEYEFTTQGEDKIKALDLLGKSMALWTDKQQIDANIIPVFIDDIGSDEDDG